MQIRPARPTDVEALRRCAAAAYGRYTADIGRAPAPMLVDFDRQVADGIVHVIPAADGIDGYIVFYPEDGAMHLESVAVRPSAAGRGIGGALIGFCEAEARRQGLPKVALYTNAKMTANLALYPHLGYRQTDRRVENGFDRVYFEKPLD